MLNESDKSFQTSLKHRMRIPLCLKIVKSIPERGQERSLGVNDLMPHVMGRVCVKNVKDAHVETLSTLLVRDRAFDQMMLKWPKILVAALYEVFGRISMEKKRKATDTS